MVDSLIPKSRNEQDLQDVIDQRNREKLLYPNFLDSAELGSEKSYLNSRYPFTRFKNSSVEYSSSSN